MGKSVKSLLLHKRYLSAVFLFFFAFSGEALLYSTHLVKEYGHNHVVQASISVDAASAATVEASHQHDGDQGEGHGDHESCCDHHSHASILYQPICFQHFPQLISRPVGEPFRFIPEVYLDKFIPPQNLV